MTIIFDLDGTLINSEYHLKKIETEVKRELGITISFEEQKERFGGVGLEQQLAMDSSIPKDFLPICEQRFRECGPSVLKPNPGVENFLDNWDQPMCVASNGPIKWISFALECTGLLKHFPLKNIFHAGLVANRKPAPDMFLLAAKEMNVQDNDALVIEDSIIGVQAAKAANIKALAYTGCSNINPELLIGAGAYASFHDFNKINLEL